MAWKLRAGSGDISHGPVAPPGGSHLLAGLLPQSTSESMLSEPRAATLGSVAQSVEERRQPEARVVCAPIAKEKKCNANY